MILIQDSEKNPIALIKKHYDSIIIKSLIPITREVPQPISQVFEYCSINECYVPPENLHIPETSSLDISYISEPYEMSESFVPEFVDAIEEPIQETEKKKKKNRKNKKQ